jgi:hypothetical protein
MSNADSAAIENADSADNANIAGIVQKCCLVRYWHCRRYSHRWY